MLKEEIHQAILTLQKLYPSKRSALIPALHLAQTELGYLPLSIQNEVAELFEIDLNEVTSVVTFYDMFFEEPVGKHLLHVCKNISCMLRGADGVLTRLCEKLQVDLGGTSKDAEFTVIPSECLGACDRAPVMLANERLIGPVREEDLDQIIQETQKGKGHPSPITIQEVLHD